MTVEKGLRRIGWRLGTGKPFQPNQEDIDSFNAIVDFVENKQKKSIIDNQLFGKLYIYLFGEFVTYYKATAMDSIPHKELNKILGKDIRLLVENVTDRLNLADMEACIKEKESLKQYNPLEYEEVADNMKVMINGAINEFSPKHLERII